jgi:hypothetical protein
MSKTQGIFFDPWDPTSVLGAEFLKLMHPEIFIKCHKPRGIHQDVDDFLKDFRSNNLTGNERVTDKERDKLRPENQQSVTSTSTRPVYLHKSFEDWCKQAENAANKRSEPNPGIDGHANKVYKNVSSKNTDNHAVEHPTHYNRHPSGTECIEVAQWFGFNLGNAIKYIWRCEHKGKQKEDIQKAIEYLKLELKRIEFMEKGGRNV